MSVFAFCCGDLATTRFAFITTFSAPYMGFKNVEGHVVKEQTLNISVVQKWGGKIVLRNVRFWKINMDDKLRHTYSYQPGHRLSLPWLFVSSSVPPDKRRLSALNSATNASLHIYFILLSPCHSTLYSPSYS